ncbi:hypothetical protein [Macrococcus brunensis]|uniref:hypothetical protein n=1 Tax=Macrococcus brunensis TaxID=198483 RepID=UPI001EF04984|nr:hypothetical protein [Macrococcus brunensis]ULG70889.1 hypothetical protein MGG12_05860 [Macrococcus brunensis]
MPLEDKDTIIKIFESLGEIKGQLANLDVVREKADSAHEKASTAIGLSGENKEDIAELKTKHGVTAKVAHEARDMANYNNKKLAEISTNVKWFAGLSVPAIISIVLWILNQVFN